MRKYLRDETGPRRVEPIVKRRYESVSGFVREVVSFGDPADQLLRPVVPPFRVHLKGWLICWYASNPSCRSTA